MPHSDLSRRAEHTETDARISRRDVLKQGGLAALGLSLLPAGLSWSLTNAADSKKTPRILYFTKCSGFEHSVVKQKGDAPSHSGKVLLELGKKHNFEVVLSKDGRIFDSKDLDAFDALFFYTSGDLTKTGNDKNPPMSAKGKERLLEVVSAYFIDELGWSRRTTVWTASAITLVVGVPSALAWVGARPWATAKLLGFDGVFSLMDFTFVNVSLPLGAVLLCLFGTYVWGLRGASDEILSSSPGFARVAPAWRFFVRWVCPIFIAIILISQFVSL